MSRRNGFIDFLKFAFSIVVVLHHAAPILNVGDTGIFTCGYIAVEFFFMVSGYLIAKKAEKSAKEDIYRENFALHMSRVKSIFPFLLLAVLTANLMYRIGRYSFKSLFDAIILSSVDMFGVQMIGFTGFYAIGVSWYLSILFFCGFLIYPMICNNQTKFATYTAPLLALVFMGYICHRDNTLCNPGLWYEYFHKGLLRGFADIALGATSYEIRKAVDKTEMTTKNSVLFKLAEGAIYILTLYYGLFVKEPGQFDFFFPALLCISVAISFSNKGISNVAFKSKLWNFLGIFSLSIFLNHYYVSVVLLDLFPRSDRNKVMVTYLILIVMISIFNYVAGKLLINKKSRIPTTVVLAVGYIVCLAVVSQTNGMFFK